MAPRSAELAECTPADWIRMYREGIPGGAISQLCDGDDVLRILNTLAEARRQDPALESEHSGNFLRHAREVEEELARKRAFTPAWQSRLAELQGYVREHDRMPRQVGGDRDETSLGKWLHAQRHKAGKGTLNALQRGALDQVGDWDSRRRSGLDETRFIARLLELAEFTGSHGRLPGYRAGADAGERNLRAWLHSVRQSAAEGRLPAKHRAELDRGVPGWDEAR